MERMRAARGRQGAGRGAARRPQGRALDRAQAGRRDRLHRVHRDGILRHPSFLGLREDKPAKEVVREMPKHLKASREERRAADRRGFGIEISNPDRVIFPEDGLTKSDLADYYAAVDPLIMVDAAKRPMTLIRCPAGRAKKCFFQKHDSGTFGPHVKHIPIKEKDGDTEDYLYFDDIQGLLACVQMGTIEFHGWGSKVDKVEYPDRLVFDLDPDVGLDFAKVKEAAVRLHGAARRPRPEELPAAVRRQGHSRRRAARRVEGLADGQELRRALQPRHRRGRAGDVHRQHPQGAAQGPHLPRLAAQPARRDRGHAVLGARARRRAGRGAGRLGRARPLSTAAITSASATPTSCWTARARRCLPVGARRSKPCPMHKPANSAPSQIRRARLSVQDCFDAWLTYYPPHLSQPAHEHGCSQFSLLLSGGLIEHVDGREFRAGPGQASAKAKGTAHADDYGPEGALLLSFNFRCEDTASALMSNSKWQWRSGARHSRHYAASLARMERGRISTRGSGICLRLVSRRGPPGRLSGCVGFVASSIGRAARLTSVRSPRRRAFTACG